MQFSFRFLFLSSITHCFSLPFPISFLFFSFPFISFHFFSFPFPSHFFSFYSSCYLCTCKMVEPEKLQRIKKQVKKEKGAKKKKEMAVASCPFSSTRLSGTAACSQTLQHRGPRAPQAGYRAHPCTHARRSAAACSRLPPRGPTRRRSSWSSAPSRRWQESDTSQYRDRSLCPQFRPSGSSPGWPP